MLTKSRLQILQYRRHQPQRGPRAELTRREAKDGPWLVWLMPVCLSPNSSSGNQDAYREAGQNCEFPACLGPGTFLKSCVSASTATPVY
jgi:hypothetical protein